MREEQKIYVAFSATFALVIFVLIYFENRLETVAMPKAFAAWCKQTGNPKELTYEEWRALVSASENQNSGSVLIVPIYQPR